MVMGRASLKLSDVPKASEQTEGNITFSYCAKNSKPE